MLADAGGRVRRLWERGEIPLAELELDVENQALPWGRAREVYELAFGAGWFRRER